MSESLTAARPYAKALCEVATQSNIDSWVPLMQLCQSLGENDDCKRFLNAHDLTVDRFNALMQSLLAQSGETTQIPEKFDNFTGLLAKNKRFGLLPDIARLFIDEVNKSNATIVAKIITAKPLTEKSHNNLISRLTEKYGKKIEASVVIDETLIGGAIIKVGDTIIDGSVKGRLEQLTKALN